MRLQIARARWLNAVLPNRTRDATKEHESILNGLMCNDRDRSVSSLRLHLENSKRNFIEVLSSPKYSLQFTQALAHFKDQNG